MGPLHKDLAQGLAQARQAELLTTEKLKLFGELCEVYDWEQAEVKRAEVVAHFEAYLDLLMTTFKRLEVAEGV